VARTEFFIFKVRLARRVRAAREWACLPIGARPSRAFQLVPGVLARAFPAGAWPGRATQLVLRVLLLRASQAELAHLPVRHALILSPMAQGRDGSINAPETFTRRELSVYTARCAMSPRVLPLEPLVQRARASVRVFEFRLLVRRRVGRGSMSGAFVYFAWAVVCTWPYHHAPRARASEISACGCSRAKW
jgi:hypothetical protein